MGDRLKCKSGQHAWFFFEDRQKCCAGYRRVEDADYEVLASLGAENIVHRGGLWRGWVREDRADLGAVPKGEIAPVAPGLALSRRGEVG